MLRDLFSLFPAYAGVILGCPLFTRFFRTFPRIRGGDPSTASSSEFAIFFSPHTRGGDPAPRLAGFHLPDFSPHTRG